MYDSSNNECVFAASHITIQCGKQVVGKSKVGKRTLNFKISSYDESTRQGVKKRHRSGGTLGSSQSVQQAVVGADIRAVHVHYNNVVFLLCCCIQELLVVSQLLYKTRYGCFWSGAGFTKPCALLKLDFLTSAYKKCMR